MLAIVSMSVVLPLRVFSPYRIKNTSYSVSPVSAYPTAFYKPKQTTPLFDDETVTITHPFHPNAGKAYRLVGINKSHGKEKLLCQDVDNKEFLIPIQYTNMAQKAKSTAQVEMSCDFTYDDLIMLLDIIGNIVVK
jgi:hypothetical protein